MYKFLLSGRDGTHVLLYSGAHMGRRATVRGMVGRTYVARRGTAGVLPRPCLRPDREHREYPVRVPTDWTSVDLCKG